MDYIFKTVQKLVPSSEISDQHDNGPSYLKFLNLSNPINLTAEIQHLKRPSNQEHPSQSPTLKSQKNTTSTLETISNAYHSLKNAKASQTERNVDQLQNALSKGTQREEELINALQICNSDLIESNICNQNLLYDLEFTIKQLNHIQELYSLYQVKYQEKCLEFDSLLDHCELLKKTSSETISDLQDHFSNSLIELGQLRSDMKLLLNYSKEDTSTEKSVQKAFKERDEAKYLAFSATLLAKSCTQQLLDQKLKNKTFQENKQELNFLKDEVNKQKIIHEESNLQIKLLREALIDSINEKEKTYALYIEHQKKLETMKFQLKRMSRPEIHLQVITESCVPSVTKPSQLALSFHDHNSIEDNEISSFSDESYTGNIISENLSKTKSYESRSFIAFDKVSELTPKNLQIKPHFPASSNISKTSFTSHSGDNLIHSKAIKTISPTIKSHTPFVKIEDNLNKSDFNFNKFNDTFHDSDNDIQPLIDGFDPIKDLVLDHHSNNDDLNSIYYELDSKYDNKIYKTKNTSLNSAETNFDTIIEKNICEDYNNNYKNNLSLDDLEEDSHINLNELDFEMHENFDIVDGSKPPFKKIDKFDAQAKGRNSQHTTSNNSEAIVKSIDDTTKQIDLINNYKNLICLDDFEDFEIIESEDNTQTYNKNKYFKNSSEIIILNIEENLDIPKRTVKNNVELDNIDIISDNNHLEKKSEDILKLKNNKNSYHSDPEDSKNDFHHTHSDKEISHKQQLKQNDGSKNAYKVANQFIFDLNQQDHFLIPDLTEVADNSDNHNNTYSDQKRLDKNDEINTYLNFPSEIQLNENLKKRSNLDTAKILNIQNKNFSKIEILNNNKHISSYNQNNLCNITTQESETPAKSFTINLDMPAFNNYNKHPLPKTSYELHSTPRYPINDILSHRPAESTPNQPHDLSSNLSPPLQLKPCEYTSNSTQNQLEEPQFSPDSNKKEASPHTAHISDSSSITSLDSFDVIQCSDELDCLEIKLDEPSNSYQLLASHADGNSSYINKQPTFVSSTEVKCESILPDQSHNTVTAPDVIFEPAQHSHFIIFPETFDLELKDDFNYLSSHITKNNNSIDLANLYEDQDTPFEKHNCTISSSTQENLIPQPSFSSISATFQETTTGLNTLCLLNQNIQQEISNLSYLQHPDSIKNISPASSTQQAIPHPSSELNTATCGLNKVFKNNFTNLSYAKQTLSIHSQSSNHCELTDIKQEPMDESLETYNIKASPFTPFDSSTSNLNLTIKNESDALLQPTYIESKTDECNDFQVQRDYTPINQTPTPLQDKILSNDNFYDPALIPTYHEANNLSIELSRDFDDDSAFNQISSTTSSNLFTSPHKVNVIPKTSNPSYLPVLSNVDQPSFFHSKDALFSSKAHLKDDLSNQSMENILNEIEASGNNLIENLNYVENFEPISPSLDKTYKLNVSNTNFEDLIKTKENKLGKPHFPPAKPGYIQPNTPPNTNKELEFDIIPSYLSEIETASTKIKLDSILNDKFNAPRLKEKKDIDLEEFLNS